MSLITIQLQNSFMLISFFFLLKKQSEREKEREKVLCNNKYYIILCNVLCIFLVLAFYGFNQYKKCKYKNAMKYTNNINILFHS